MKVRRPLRLLIVVALSGTVAATFLLLVPGTSSLTSLPKVGPTRPDAPPPQMPSGSGADGGSDARTGFDALRRRFPLPAGATPLVSVGSQLTMNMVPMNLASFETKLRPEQVLAFYSDHFTSQGYTVLGPGVLPGPHPALSVTDLSKDVQLTVMTIREPGESVTTVILGLADMEAYKNNLEGSGEDLEDFPRYPGSDVTVMRSRDPEAPSLTITFETPDAPDRVEQFYNEQLPARGYGRLKAEETPQASQRWEFASSTGTWSLSWTRVGDKTSVMAHKSGGNARASDVPSRAP